MIHRASLFKKLTAYTTKKLTEDKSRVNSIIRRQRYLELLEREVGFLGPITSKDLYKGSSLRGEAEKLQRVYYDEDNDYVADNSNILYKIWERYKKAMTRQRTYVLGFSPFVNYIVYSDYPVYIFKYNKSYIIGQLTEGYFRVSHFAPSSLREGIEAIRELIKFDNIIFAVTEDLKDMLFKMGAYYDGMVFPMIFAGVVVDKHILVTDKKTLTKIATRFSKIEDEELDDEFSRNTDRYKEYPESEIYLKRMR